MFLHTFLSGLDFYCTDFEWTTINEISKWSFLCFRVSENFPSTGNLELLYADNFIFTR